MVLLLVTALLVLVKAIFVDGTVGTNPWIYAHWLFDYRWGFVKRGLPGEALRQLSVGRDSVTVNVISLALATGLTLALTLLFGTRAARGDGGDSWLFAFFALLSPATVAHLGFDVGRFDHLLLLLALAALLAVLHGTRRVAVWSVVTTTVVGVLVHEIYAIAFLPMVLGVWFYVDHGGRRFNSLRGILCLCFAALTCLVMSVGKLSGPEVESFLTFVHREHGLALPAGDGLENPAMVLNRALGDNFSLVADQLFSTTSLKHHLTFGAVLAPTFRVLIDIIRRLDVSAEDDGERLRQASLFACGLSPLALYVVGVDFFRWWSLALSNVFLVMVLLMGHAGKRHVVAEAIRTHRRLVYLAILLGLVFGPLGHTTPFGVTDELWRWMERMPDWLA